MVKISNTVEASTAPKQDLTQQLKDNLAASVARGASIDEMYASIGNMSVYLPDADKTILLGALDDASLDASLSESDRALVYDSLKAFLLSGVNND